MYDIVFIKMNIIRVIPGQDYEMRGLKKASIEVNLLSHYNAVEKPFRTMKIKII